MREDVRQALAIDASSTAEERTIDITTTGRRSGEPRRIEIVNGPGSLWPEGVPDEWVASSPLAKVTFAETN